MKKLIVALAAVSMVGGAYASIYAAPYVYYGIGGNGDNGGIVNAVQGTTVLMQIIDGGGDGLDYTGGQVIADPLLAAGSPLIGNDILIGSLQAVVTADYLSDFSDYAYTISGAVGGNTTAWTADTYVRVSGVLPGDWVYEESISFVDGDYSDPKAVPESVIVGATDSILSADGSVTVIPEPATIGLMGIAGLGMFLARRKTRR